MPASTKILRLMQRLAQDEALKTIRGTRRAAEKVATWETRPGAGMGMDPLYSAPEAAQERAARELAGAALADNQDRMVSAAGIPNTVRQMQGAYTPPGGPTEYNPGFATVAGPETPMKDLQAASALRDFMLAQNASAGHAVGNTGPMNALSIGSQGPMDRQTMMAIQQAANQRAARAGQPGMIASADTGAGTTVFDLPSMWGDQAAMPPEQVARAVPAIERLARQRGAPVDVQRVNVPESFYTSLGENRGPGGQGGMTGALMETIRGASPEAQRGLTTSPEVMGMAGDVRAAYERLGQPLPPDFDRALAILQQGGVRALRRALERGVVLPATAAMLVGGQAGQEPVQ